MLTDKQMAQAMMERDAGRMPLAYYQNFVRMARLMRSVEVEHRAQREDRAHNEAMDAVFGHHGQG